MPGQSIQHLAAAEKDSHTECSTCQSFGSMEEVKVRTYYGSQEGTSANRSESQYRSDLQSDVQTLDSHSKEKASTDRASSKRREDSAMLLYWLRQSQTDEPYSGLGSWDVNRPRF
ncbi:hypothetical protein TWF481_006271 [Arthrobotrys musiformis]|uniref:Uncharacterized protein n=1 Tax=Arthrobotrys musiformis TaxID=47236 RepID=A0AAV9WI82_9PEZI